MLYENDINKNVIFFIVSLFTTFILQKRSNLDVTITEMSLNFAKIYNLEIILNFENYNDIIGSLQMIGALFNL